MIPLTSLEPLYPRFGRQFASPYLGNYYEIVPNSFQPEKTDRLTGGSFDSDIRTSAIMLQKFQKRPRNLMHSDVRVKPKCR